MTIRVASPERANALRCTLIGCLLLLSGGLVFGRQIDVVLLHTSDVRGHVLSLPDRERAETWGGLLRCAAIVQKEREQSPNVLLFDAGGFLRGSAESWLTDGGLPAAAADWMRYDAMLFEAHDTESVGPRLSSVLSNVAASDGTRWRLAGVEPFRVFDADGLRVAVLALDESAGHDTDALRKVLQDVREERPRLVVLLWRHPADEENRSDLERARELASLFPEINVILGSGSTRARRQERVRQALYTDAGSQGRYVGRVALTFDTVADDLVQARAELLPATHDVEESDALRQVLGSDLSGAKAKLSRVLTHNVRKLKGSSDWPGQSGVQRLVCTAVGHASNADVVLYAKRAKAALAEGPVRLADLFRLVPARDRWQALLLVPAELRQLLEANGTLLETDSFLGCHGITYRFDADVADGDRVRELKLEDGTKPHGRKRLLVIVPEIVTQRAGPVALSWRTLAADPICRAKLLDIDTQSALIDYVEQQESLDLKPQKGMLSP